MLSPSSVLAGVPHIAEPAPPEGVPPWQLQSAWVVHWLLYILLFVIPILGWLNASWRGMPIVMFGLELPKLVATRAPGFGWTGDVHALLANYLMLTLVGLHVLAGLYHTSSAATGFFSACCQVERPRVFPSPFASNPPTCGQDRPSRASILRASSGSM